jgi:hypothetical protein
MTKQEDAQILYNLLIRLNDVGTISSIERGKALLEIHDKKLWEALDAESFEDLLARPELGCKRATAYADMRLVKKFGDDDLAGIAVSRLNMIASIVTDENKKEWLEKALSYSWKDFINEVRKEKGKGEMPHHKSPDILVQVGIFSPKAYIKWVKFHSCLIPNCGKKSTSHHFPRTKGAGADSWKVIPLCEYHHAEAQEGGSKWLWENRMWLFDWFYNLAVKS